jgi:hypothetical protein
MKLFLAFAAPVLLPASTAAIRPGPVYGLGFNSLPQLNYAVMRARAEAERRAT